MVTQLSQKELRTLTPIQRQTIMGERLAQEEVSIKQKELENIPIDEYVEKYQNVYSSLSSKAKKYFRNPEEVKAEIEASPEYQEYMKQKAEYEKAQKTQEAYERVMRHYKKGMLWAIAAFGEGEERRIAKEMIKKGYAPSEMALQREYEERLKNKMKIQQGAKELGITPQQFVSLSIKNPSGFQKTTSIAPTTTELIDTTKVEPNIQPLGQWVMGGLMKAGQWAKTKMTSGFKTSDKPLFTYYFPAMETTAEQIGINKYIKKIGEIYTKPYKEQPSLLLTAKRETIGANVPEYNITSSIAGNVAEAAVLPMRIISGIAERTGKGYEGAARLFGYDKEYIKTYPEKLVPQRVTIGGEFKYPKIETTYNPADIAYQAGKNIGTITPWLLLPQKIVIPYFIGGGLSVATAPKYTSITPEERMSGAIMTSIGILAGVNAGYKALTKPKISFQEIVVKQHGKTAEPNIFISKPKQVIIRETPSGIKVVRTKVNILGSGQAVQIGRKTIVTTPIRQFFGYNPLYEGIPYGNLKAYSKTLNFLIKQGYSEAQAKAILRNYQPKLSDLSFKGQGIITQVGEASPLIEVFGTKTKIPLGQELGTRLSRKEITGIQAIGKIKTIKGKDIFKIYSAEAEAKLGKTFAQTPYQQARIRLYEEIGKSIPIKETEFLDLYQQTGTYKIFGGRKIYGESAKVYIQKGKPDIILNIESPIKIKQSVISTSAKPNWKEVKIPSEQLKDIVKISKEIYGIETPSAKSSSTPIIQDYPKISREILSSETKQNLATLSGGIIKTENVAPKSVSLVSTTEKITTIPAASPKSILKEQSQSKESPASKTEFKQIDLSLTKVTPKTITTLTEIPALKFEQSQIVQPISTQLMQPSKTPKPVELITPPIIPIKTFEKSQGKRITTIKKALGLYKIFEKRKGKDIQFASTTNLKEAGRILKTRLARTLGASGFIKDITGRKLKATDIDLGLKFEPSKKDITRLVEKRKYRLDTKSELMEIKKARRAKKIKWW